MADNGQIDNIYIDFEVKDNGADDKISKFDEALEKLIVTLESIDDKLSSFKDNFNPGNNTIGAVLEKDGYFKNVILSSVSLI